MHVPAAAGGTGFSSFSRTNRKLGDQGGTETSFAVNAVSVNRDCKPEISFALLCVFHNSPPHTTYIADI